jgi:hypothetical protein
METKTPVVIGVVKDFNYRPVQGKSDAADVSPI